MHPYGPIHNGVDMSHPVRNRCTRLPIWTGVDMSTPLWPEGVREIHGDPVEFMEAIASAMHEDCRFPIYSKVAVC